MLTTGETGTGPPDKNIRGVTPWENSHRALLIPRSLLQGSSFRIWDFEFWIYSFSPASSNFINVAPVGSERLAIISAGLGRSPDPLFKAVEGAARRTAW